MKFELPLRRYSSDCLSPYIDKLTMDIHYNGHHVAYINALNNEIKDWPNKNPNQFLLNVLSKISEYPKIIRNNAGGHFNHSMFWKILTPEKKDIFDYGKILNAIEKKFGSFESFKNFFSEKAKAVFGSGWTWLCKDKEGSLFITTTANQDNPLMDVISDENKGIPVLCLDVWEHAYYLQYKNNRIDYINAFWNVVDWQEVEKNFL